MFGVANLKLPLELEVDALLGFRISFLNRYFFNDMLSFKIEVFNKHVVVAHLFMANQWCNICELFAILMAAESIAICLSLWHDFTFGDSLINKVLGGLKFYFV